MVGLAPTLGVGCWVGVGARGGWCGCPPLYRTPLSLNSGSTAQNFLGVGVLGGVILFVMRVPFVWRVEGRPKRSQQSHRRCPIRLCLGLGSENGSIYCVGMPQRLEGVIVFEGVVAVGGVGLIRGGFTDLWPALVQGEMGGKELPRVVNMQTSCGGRTKHGSHKNT